MTLRPPTAPDQSRAERIGHEVKTIRDMGYPCDLQQDQDGIAHYLTVELTRDTMEGPQPVRVYLKLNAGFPDSPPDLVVTVITTSTTSAGELAELSIEAESKTRLSWSAHQMIYQIIQEVQDSVQGQNLRLATMAAPPAAIPTALPRPTDRTSSPAQRRSASGMIAAIVGGTAVLLLAGGLTLYYGVLYDACGADQRLVTQAQAAGDLDSLRQATRTLETMRARGQSGERGSCRALATDPAPLRAAHERYGDTLLAAGQIDDAAAAYGQALALDPAATAAQAGLTQVRAARTVPLWEEVERLWPVNSAESWPKAVAALEQIRVIDPDALSPAGQISATLRLAQAQIRWGDLLFAADPTAAGTRYEAARALGLSDTDMADRLAWAARSSKLRAATLDTWPALIAELDQVAAERPALRDPAGRGIDQRRYDAHVAYGRALLDQGGAVGAETLAQADAGLGLSQAAEDKGESARLIKREAEALLAAASGYQIGANAVDAQAWGDLLADRRIDMTLADRPVNLVIVAPTANLVVNITSSGGSQQIITDRTGVAIAALPGGRYLISLADRTAAGEVALDLSTALTYLVRITPR